jgi:asparagine synthase (glutamine-hydrolysing)
MIRSAPLSPEDGFLMNFTYLDEDQKAHLYLANIRTQLSGTDPWSEHRGYFRNISHADFLNQMLYVDSKTFNVSLNLTYNDKMSMASSVEVRVPFLDRELVEFVAWNVRPELKLKGFLRPTTKHIFRKAMRGVLPAEVLDRSKAGFGAPIDYWLSYDLRDMVDDLLSEKRIASRGYFEPAVVRRMITEHRSGRQDWSMQIWQFLTFELWLQAFVDH